MALPRLRLVRLNSTPSPPLSWAPTLSPLLWAAHRLAGAHESGHTPWIGGGPQVHEALAIDGCVSAWMPLFFAVAEQAAHQVRCWRADRGRAASSPPGHRSPWAPPRTFREDPQGALEHLFFPLDGPSNVQFGRVWPGAAMHHWAAIGRSGWRSRQWRRPAWWPPRQYEWPRNSSNAGRQTGHELREKSQVSGHGRGPRPRLTLPCTSQWFSPPLPFWARAALPGLSVITFAEPGQFLFSRQHGA